MSSFYFLLLTLTLDLLSVDLLLSHWLRGAIEDSQCDFLQTVRFRWWHLSPSRIHLKNAMNVSISPLSSLLCFANLFELSYSHRSSLNFRLKSIQLHLLTRHRHFKCHCWYFSPPSILEQEFPFH